MSDMMAMIQAWIDAKVAAQIRYAEIAERLTAADILALEAAWTPAYGTLFKRVSEDVQEQVENHPLGEAYDKAARAAIEARKTPVDYDSDEPAMDITNRVWRLFRVRGDDAGQRRAHFEEVAAGPNFTLVFADMIDPSDIEALKAPWRAALGSKFDID